MIFNLKENSKWLVTGGGGFIGSHLTEELLHLGQEVVVLDNFSTGSPDNLNEVKLNVGAEKWKNFTLVRGDISRFNDIKKACRNVEYVLHQAGLGSVPRSISDPISTNEANVTGFINVLVAAKEQNVKKVIYASSSSVYGDHASLPKKESRIGQPLSPYAASKRCNELYAAAFSHSYGLPVIGLRYFNIFGPRQSLNGPYAAVIPKWISALLQGKQTEIYGDGKTSRDFCFVTNVVRANILAAIKLQSKNSDSFIFNIAASKRTTLMKLHQLIRNEVLKKGVHTIRPLIKPERQGDVKHSKADISLARKVLGYEPAVHVEEGVQKTVEWYSRRMEKI